MDLDYILRELGEFGKYQICVYFLLFFPLIFSAMGSLDYVFSAGDIFYRCEIPECETNITSYEKPWLPFALPFKNGKLEGHCKRYKSFNHSYNENCTKNIFNHQEIEECHSFVFKNNENTIIKEFDLLCEKNAWKRTLLGTLHNIGEFIGMPLAGLFSDRFGRKTMIMTAVVCSSLLGTLKSFSASYNQFLACEIADAIALGGLYSGIFILGVEITGPKKRALGGVILSSYYSVGEIILGLIVWHVNDWRTYLRIIYMPGFIIIIYYWILPESIRWLISHGKREKLFKTLERLSSLNKRPMSEEVRKAIEEKESSNNVETKRTESMSSSHEPKNPIKDAFKSKIMLLRIINCSFCWITNALVYYGLSLSSVVIGGNKYFNFILVSFIEIPGYIITSFVINIFGRKKSLTVTLIISGLACTMSHFVPAGAYIITVILFLIGKCAITVSFTALYVSASEFFPTTIRHSLMAFCSTLGRFGSMIAPQMPLLSAYLDPLLILGAVAFVAGCLALYFPETLNCKLPDNIEEAEKIDRGPKTERS